MRRLLLVNPNTNPATTSAMVAIAMEQAGGRIGIEGVTVARGAPKVVDAAMLETAADAVLELLRSIDLTLFQGVIIAGFGDPGLARIRALTRVPTTGIAEAAMAEAAAGGRRFSIVVTTPGLVPAIEARVAAYGCGQQFAGVRLTGGASGGRRDEPPLPDAIRAACEAAISEDGAEAIIVGGGPLAATARALRSQLPVPLVEPVPAAIRLAIARSREFAGEAE